MHESQSSGATRSVAPSELTLPRRRSLTRQTAAIFAGGLVAQASFVVLLSGLTRLVSKDQLGAYQQLTLLYGIVSPLLVAGIPTALLYFIPRSKNRDETRSWVGTAYVVLGSLGLIFSATTALARVPIANALGNGQLSPVLLIYSPYPGLAFVASVLPPALVALGRAGRATIVGVSGSMLSVVCVLTSVAVAPNAMHIAAGLVIGQVCFTVVSVLTVAHVVGVRVTWRGIAGRCQALLKFGVPLALTGLAGMLAFQFDRLVVSRNFSVALYAVYSVGAVELPISVLVQQSVNLDVDAGVDTASSGGRHRRHGCFVETGGATDESRAFSDVRVLHAHRTGSHPPLVRCFIRGEHRDVQDLSLSCAAACCDLRSDHAGDRPNRDQPHWVVRLPGIERGSRACIGRPDGFAGSGCGDRDRDCRLGRLLPGQAAQRPDDQHQDAVAVARIGDKPCHQPDSGTPSRFVRRRRCRRSPATADCGGGLSTVLPRPALGDAPA